MTFLMLRDIPVYNITPNIALALNLCPFVETLDTKKSFETWKKYRAYLKTNRTAERVVVQSKKMENLKNDYNTRSSRACHTKNETLFRQ